MVWIEVYYPKYSIMLTQQYRTNGGNAEAHYTNRDKLNTLQHGKWSRLHG